jgi:NAD(P)-dependent dehydrogenase (short-subunit alcohol dehydrogenase family)
MNAWLVNDLQQRIEKRPVMPDLLVDLTDKGVIVTAAGGSIGSACALALARCGASLALNDIDIEALARTVERVRELGGTAMPLVGDVSEYATVQSMAQEAIEALGNIFGLVNIAGASMPKPIRSIYRAL